MTTRCHCVVCLTADAAPMVLLQWLAAGATRGGLAIGGWIGWVCAGAAAFVALLVARNWSRP